MIHNTSTWYSCELLMCLFDSQFDPNNFTSADAQEVWLRIFQRFRDAMYLSEWRNRHTLSCHTKLCCASIYSMSWKWRRKARVTVCIPSPRLYWYPFLKPKIEPLYEWLILNRCVSLRYVVGIIHYPDAHLISSNRCGMWWGVNCLPPHAHGSFGGKMLRALTTTAVPHAMYWPRTPE